MNNRFFVLTLISFLLFSSVCLALPYDFDVNKTEEPYKGIVVSKISHSNMPQMLESDKTDVDNIIKDYDGKITWTSRYSHFYVNMPKEKYSETVEKLKENGYEVRDELIYKELDSESLRAMGVPANCLGLNNNVFPLEGRGIKIGILDSGVDSNHSDLIGKIAGWRDSVEIVKNNNYSSTTPYDNDGHGTAMASIAVGTGAASNGSYRGVATGAQIYMGRVTDENGESKEEYLEDGIIWLTDEGVDVISMSLGIVANDIYCDSTSGVNAAIQYALAQNIVLVAAAGNEGPYKSIIVNNDSFDTVYYEGLIEHPACVNGVISVGASYKKDYPAYEKISYNELFTTGRVHVIIEINNQKVKEYEFEALDTELTNYTFEKAGFDIALTPSSWPANVKVKFEAIDKIIAHHHILGDVKIREDWYPGNKSKGDSFWEYEYNFNRGNQIAVQFSAWPVTAQTPGTAGWTHYHSYFYRPSADGNYTKYHNIWLNVVNTTGGLAELSPRTSNRGGYFDAYPLVVAPAYMVCGSWPTNLGPSVCACNNTNYSINYGTSAATPHVAGLVALLKEANPFLYRFEITNAIIHGADLIYPDARKEPFNYLTNSVGYGRINATKSLSDVLNFQPSGGYADINEDPAKCFNYDYSKPSANQIRSYYPQCPYPNYNCEVTYDSTIKSVCVNGNCGKNNTGQYTNPNDVYVRSDSNIEVEVEIKNTGKNVQKNWYVGVEFWNVSNFSDPWGTRDTKGRINAYYNEKDGSHGCVINPDPLHSVPGYCPSGVNCSLVSESMPDSNHWLDPNEVIKVKCWAPASFYPLPSYAMVGRCEHSGSLNGIMFWVHERDLTQDATNNGDPDGDGNVGDWWSDALAIANPAIVKVGTYSSMINESDGGKNYLKKGSCNNSGLPNNNVFDRCTCWSHTNWLYCNNKYASNKQSCESDSICFWALVEALPSVDICDMCFLDCKNTYANSYCSDGACVIAGGGGGGCGFRSCLRV